MSFRGNEFKFIYDIALRVFILGIIFDVIGVPTYRPYYFKEVNKFSLEDLNKEWGVVNIEEKTEEKTEEKIEK